MDEPTGLHKSSGSTGRTILWVNPGPQAGPMNSAKSLEITSELVKLGWQVILTFTGSTGRRQLRGVNIVVFPVPDIYILRHIIFHLHLYRLILAWWPKLDVILFQQTSVAWLMPLRFGRALLGAKRPVFVLDTRTIHMLRPDKENIKDRLRRRMWEAMEQIGNRWADGRLAITRRMAQTVGIPPGKLWGIWPSGVEPHLFDTARRGRSWPLPGQQIRLIYVGVLDYERNLMALCRAAEEANAKGMAFELWLVGEGSERKELEVFAARTEGRVRVIGPVPHSQIPQILTQTHMGALPFPDKVNFQVSSPLKLFEYMAAGMPVLATRIACHEDVIGTGDFAVWAETSDEAGLFSAMTQAWNKRDCLERMGAEAQIAVQPWTWHESAKKLVEALESGLERD